MASVLAAIKSRARDQSFFLNYMLVVDGFGHERDSQDDDTGGDEQDDGEVEVVDATYDGGTIAGAGAAARPVGELCDHSGEANREANYEAAKCTLKEVRRNLIGQLESVIDRMFIQKCFFFFEGGHPFKVKLSNSLY